MEESKLGVEATVGAASGTSGPTASMTQVVYSVSSIVTTPNMVLVRSMTASAIGALEDGAGDGASRSDLQAVLKPVLQCVNRVGIRKQFVTKVLKALAASSAGPEAVEVLATGAGKFARHCLDDSARLTLMEWVAGAARSLAEPYASGDAPQWFNRCFAVLCDLAGTINAASTGSRASTRAVATAARRLRRFLRGEAAVGAAAEAVLAMGPGAATAAGLTAVAAAAGSAGVLPALRDRLLPCYTALLIDPKSAVVEVCMSAPATAPAAALVATLTHDDLAGGIMPCLVRGFKGKTLTTLKAATALLAACPLDVSRYFGDALLPAIVAGVTSTKAPVQEAALGLMAAAAPRCSDGDVLVGAIEALVVPLTTKRAAVWQTRHGCASAVDAIRKHATRLTAAGVRAVAAAGVAALTASIAKESHEAVRGAVLGCLGRWLAVHGSFPEPTVAAIGKGLAQAATAVAAPYTNALLLACSNTDNYAALGPLVPALLKLAGAGQAPPHVVSYALLLAASAHDDAILAALQAASAPPAPTVAAGRKAASGKRGGKSAPTPAKAFSPLGALSSPSSVAHPQALLSPCGRSGADVAENEAPLTALAAAYAAALRVHGDAVKPFRKQDVAAGVLAGTGCGDGRAAAAEAVGAPAPGTAVAAAGAGGAARGSSGKAASPPPVVDVHPIMDSLVALLSHPVTGVRQAATRAVHDLYATYAELPASLLAAFVSRVTTSVAAEPVVAAYGWADGDRESTWEHGRWEAGYTFPDAPLPRFLREALVAIVPPGPLASVDDGASALSAAFGVDTGDNRQQQHAASLLPQVALMAHHPAVAPTPKAASATWRRCLRRLTRAAGLEATLAPCTPPAASGVMTGAATSGLDALLQRDDTQAALRRLLLGAHGLWSRWAPSRAAAVATTAALFRGTAWMAPGAPGVGVAPGCGAGGRLFVIAHVLPAVRGAMVEPTSAVMTALDVCIWEHPPQTVYVGAEGDGGSLSAHAVTSKNVRRDRVGKKGRGGFVDDDELYLEKLSAEMKAKRMAGKGATGKGGAAPDADALKLQEQAGVRATVEAVAVQLLPAMDALKAVADAHPVAARPLVAALLPPVLRLLKHALGRRAARSAAAALVRAGVAGTAAAPAADVIADCVVRVGASPAPAATAGDALKAATGAICRACLPASPLPAPALAALVPVFKAVLEPATPLPLHQPILSVLHLHAALPAGIHAAADAAVAALNAAPAPPPVALAANASGALPALSGADSGAVTTLSHYASVTAASAGRRRRRLRGPGPAATPTPDAALCEFGAWVAVRPAVLGALLSVLASAPKANPAPDAVLGDWVKGVADEDADGSPVFTAGPADVGVLLGDRGLLSPTDSIRDAALCALDYVIDAHPVADAASAADAAAAAAAGGSGEGAAPPPASPAPALVSALWVATHDATPDVNEFAKEMWARAGCEVSPRYAEALVPLLAHGEATVRQRVAKALAGAMAVQQATAEDTLSAVYALFEANATGLALTVPTSWHGRQGALAAVGACGSAASVPGFALPPVLPFVVSRGLPDAEQEVRSAALAAGVELVDAYGDSAMEVLLPVLEDFLREGAASPLAADSEVGRDSQREGCVVCLGKLAAHFHPEDAKVGTTVNTLLDALRTPSEPVQRACATCLPALVKHLKSSAESILGHLLRDLVDGGSYGVRRGAAFGLAGCVKGFGIAVLKNADVMATLEAAAVDKRPEHRQGALFAFECLCETLGLLFEPYVIRILPLLLKAFGDGVTSVREAAQGASKVIMGKLTGTGVKLVMPSLLKGVSEPQWRSKQASIYLLGSMAHCAPRQLSSCLPQIVPRLTDCFRDTHPKIRAAARGALTDIGSVIRNPEIKALGDVLLAALADPTEGTTAALDTLADTSFVHHIDAASLALIVPILRRGLRESKTAVKTSAGKIVGNMCSLVADAQDIVPYLGALLPPLKRVLTDPNPDARRVVARAMGSLAAGVGEDQVPDLLPWLTASMQSDGGTVERSGGAQGVAEVLVSLGEPRLSGVLHELLPLGGHPKPSVREGLLWFLAYLPPTLGAPFAAFIEAVLPVVLTGLADDVEMVREVAMRSGRAVVLQHATSHSGLLAAALRDGMLSTGWRIRQSSVELVGELMYRIAGVKAQGVADADMEGGDGGDGYANDDAVEVLGGVLGAGVRDGLLAAVYTLRSDGTGVVRQAAIQVWKSVVPNAGRVLREILPTLMDHLIAFLASPDGEQASVAGRTLGDIVKKLGDRVLPSIVPILRRGLESPGADQRQGVCLGLSEVIAACSKRQLDEHGAVLVPAVQAALCDEAGEVREAAAQAFDALQRVLGMRAVDDILPAIMAAIGGGGGADAAAAVHGLSAILALRSKEILPYLIPKLVARPITDNNAMALAAVARVTPTTLHSHFNVLLPALFEAIAGGGEAAAAGGAGAEEAKAAPVGEELAEEEVTAGMGGALGDAMKAVVLSIGAPGVHLLLTELGKFSHAANAGWRRVACWLLGEFAAGSQAAWVHDVPMVAKDLLLNINDANDAALGEVMKALGAVVATQTPEAMVQHLDFMRGIIRGVVSDLRYRKTTKAKGPLLLRGLCLPKGLGAILPVYQHALMHGAEEMRELAATGMGELVLYTSTASLRPFLTKITGPLIRIVSDKFKYKVKSAILTTLGIIIDKGGVLVKPFLPQLQPTFVKSLSDASKAVRTRAADGLGKLMAFSPRVDPIVNELVKGVEDPSASVGVQEAMVEALQAVMRFSGAKISAPVLGKGFDVLRALMADPNDTIRGLAAVGVGAALPFLENGQVDEVVGELVGGGGGGAGGDWTLLHGRRLALRAAVVHSREVVEPVMGDVVAVTVADAASDTVPVREAAAGTLGVLMEVGGDRHALHRSLMTLAKDTSSEVRCAAMVAYKRFAKAEPEAMRGMLLSVVPVLAAAVKDANLGTKLAAERALLHALQVNGDGAVLREFLGECGGELATFLASYNKRVLSKLEGDSEEE